MIPEDRTTLLLERLRAGDRGAFDDLFARVYGEMREIAHRRLLRAGPGETLNTTGLVHEAYVRLAGPGRAALTDRSHFLALASRAMRCILVDYARRRAAQKRGAGAGQARPDTVQGAAGERAVELLALDEALGRLSGFDPRLGQVVELRFFGGLTFDEIAAATGLSVPTVKRDWARARAWLHRSLSAP